MRMFLPLLAIALPAPATAQALENLDTLDQRIALALGGTADQAGVLAQPVDRRLKLAACPQPAMIEAPAIGALAVRCAALGWRIRVPLITGIGASQGELLVRKGDNVELAFTGRGFDIVTTAIAQEDGRMGAPVRVKPPTGASLVTARVWRAGSVVIED
jgi:flagellar basal body P-ring formation protein FlgA